MRTVQPQRDQVGALAGFERANFLFQARRARAQDGRHRDGLLGRDYGGIAGAHLLQIGRQVHFFHHVEIVVAAGRAVGAEADRNAERQEASPPARCRWPVSCCWRAMRHAGAVRLQDLCVGVRPPTRRARRWSGRPERPAIPPDAWASCGAFAARRHSRSWFPKDESPAARGICWRAARAAFRSASLLV